MSYLGLTVDDEYDDHVEYDDYDDVEPTHHSAPMGRGVHPDTHRPAPQPGGPVLTPVPGSGSPVAPATGEQGVVRTVSREVAEKAGARMSAGPATRSTSVRTVAVSPSRPHIVAPESFDDAQQVADRFKAEQPVILNLQEVDRDLQRRLIDFASGLSYGLGGRMARVAAGVYLLTPANVEVSDEEKRKLQERGLHS
ncbi:MAG TPA: DUF552 domain-containing protein [Acidimicrobiales bacterium]|nr:DUF552 domain-containing protein [Acidimicrobiales bacterium]